MKDSELNIQKYHLHKRNPEKLQFEMYPLQDYLSKNLNKSTIPHSHSYYQIVWFYQEGGMHHVDFQTYNINKNTILFISKDQIHSFDKNKVQEGWLIHFNESFFMHTDVDIFLKYNVFGNHQNPCYEIDIDTANVAKSYVSLIRQELTNRNRFGYEEVVRFLLKSFLISLERVHLVNAERVLKVNSNYELQYFKFQELIETNYNQGLAVRDYASRLCISSKTLTTITRSVVGKSPSQIVAERIILEAKRLLKFTPLRIGEIAYKLGFEDVSYFIKYFKRYEVCAPTKYRAETTT